MQWYRRGLASGAVDSLIDYRLIPILYGFFSYFVLFFNFMFSPFFFSAVSLWDSSEWNSFNLPVKIFLCQFARTPNEAVFFLNLRKGKVGEAKEWSVILLGKIYFGVGACTKAGMHWAWEAWLSLWVGFPKVSGNWGQLCGFVEQYSVSVSRYFLFFFLLSVVSISTKYSASLYVWVPCVCFILFKFFCVGNITNAFFLVLFVITLNIYMYNLPFSFP